jgi:putative ABC transport system permease protein
VSRLRILQSKILGLLGFLHRDDDLRTEINAHLDSLTEAHMHRGLALSAARAAARREFGGVEQTTEAYRDQRRPLLLDALAQDLRYAARAVRQQPTFTLVVVLTLALGIGANTAIFSVVNGVLLNQLPFSRADHLVWAWDRAADVQEGAVSPLDFRDYRAQQASFERFAAFVGPGPHSWASDGPAQQLNGTEVTADFFEVLGTRPLIGRSFYPSDEEHTQPEVAILSAGLWEQQYGRDPSVIGRLVRVDGLPVTVVGVMPASFTFLPRTAFWLPTPMRAGEMQRRAAHFLRPIGLLRPTVTRAIAQADVDVISSRLAETYPDIDKGWHLWLEPMQTAFVGSYREPLLLLLGAVGLVLLIACVNVINLQLARQSARTKELTTRLAIGATRIRLVRQLMTESALLAALAALVAVPLTVWVLDLLRLVIPAAVPRVNEIHIDAHVFAFTGILALVTAFVCGMVPAWRSSALSLQVHSREGGQTLGGGRLREGLVVSEVALGLCLLIGAALVVQSFNRTMRQSPGFSPSGLLTTRLMFPAQADQPERVKLLQRILDRVQAVPGVTIAGGISHLPLSDEDNNDWFRIPGHPVAPGHDRFADWRGITPGYFAAMEIPVLRGRDFITSDQATPRVVIVDASFAQAYFPGENVVGKQLLLYEGNEFLPYDVVGVVGSVHHDALDRPPSPTVYVPYDGLTNFHLLVRGVNLPALASPITHAVAMESADVALSTFEPMETVVWHSASDGRFLAWVFSSFAVLALVLAAAGIAAVFSYLVTQQTHHIGVRLALGASPRQILGHTLSRGGRLAAIGACLGMAAAVVLVRSLASVLYQVSPHDPETFIGSAVFLIAIALGACYWPARRASRVDPMVALRCE